MRSAYIGIDVAFAKRKRLPVVICTRRGGRIVPQALTGLGFAPPRGSGNAAVLDGAVVERFARDAAAYVREACAALDLVPARIAIDAPSSPREDTARRRAAEAAMDAARISCFTTPSAREFDAILAKVRAHLAAGGAESRIPHANQLWMLAGFRLFEAMHGLAPCVEVFPQATVRALGSGQVHKFKSGGTEAQLREAARHTGWPRGDAGEPAFEEIAFGPAHDRLDAYLSAWVAALDDAERVAFGQPPDDVIWVPRLEASARFQVSAAEPAAGPARKRKPPAAAPHEAARICPACGEHRFSRWPLGWDAHAAHRCAGLAAGDAATRKTEFKRRFRHLFR